MITDFVSITKVQRHANEVFDSKKTFQIVLSNNEMKGLIISAPFAKLILESDVLQQLREELWELQDPVTVKLVRDSKNTNKKRMSMDTFRKKYGI